MQLFDATGWQRISVRVHDRFQSNRQGRALIGSLTTPSGEVSFSERLTALPILRRVMESCQLSQGQRLRIAATMVWVSNGVQTGPHIGVEEGSLFAVERRVVGGAPALGAVEVGRSPAGGAPSASPFWR